jgi:flavin-dependent dehydrogenase
MRSATVIGAGPAGSTAAILLARAGWSVTLVEQHRFPRDKVCGECLSALGAEVLGRLGLLDDFLSRGAVRLGRTLLHAPSGRSVEAPLPRPMWGISRTALDGLLLDAAAGAGATVLQPARCEKLEPGDRPTVHVRDLVTNRVERLTADYLLVADGKSALLNGGPPPPTGDLGIKTHLENVDGPRDAIELFGLTGCYGGLAPIEGNRWNCALSVPAARVRRHAADLACLFAELLDENPTLRRRLARATRLGGWLASPLPRFAVRADWPANVIPIGNAAAAIEPIGGEGMGLALRSAEVAATSLLARRSTSDARRSGRLCEKYRRLWGRRRAGCRAAGLLASRRKVATAAAVVLSAAPTSLQLGMRWMGK